jgi:hypothetical protein
MSRKWCILGGHPTSTQFSATPARDCPVLNSTRCLLDPHLNSPTPNMPTSGPDRPKQPVPDLQKLTPFAAAGCPPAAGVSTISLWDRTTTAVNGMGSGLIWLPTEAYALLDVWLHEAGHNYDMAHANIPGNCGHMGDQGDPSCTMGSNSGQGIRCFNAPHNWQVGHLVRPGGECLSLICGSACVCVCARLLSCSPRVAVRPGGEFIVGLPGLTAEWGALWVTPPWLWVFVYSPRIHLGGLCSLVWAGSLSPLRVSTARWFYPFGSGAHCNNYYYCVAPLPPLPTPLSCWFHLTIPFHRSGYFQPIP